MNLSIKLVICGISFPVATITVRKEQENAFVAIVSAENVANTCSSQGDVVVATTTVRKEQENAFVVEVITKGHPGSHRSLITKRTINKSHLPMKKKKIGSCWALGRAKNDDVVDVVVDGVVDGVVGRVTENAKGDTTLSTAGKDNEKSTSGVPSITKGEASVVDDDYRKKLHLQSATGDAVVATIRKDNEKSASGVPLITEGDASATDDDYHKKLCSHPATENVKGDAIVDQVDARVRQIKNKEPRVYHKKPHSCAATAQPKISCT
ncbi:hypothetical protein QYF36_008283 [Acer negundo]|nr:hypothetical protein QYF36_008283 [Acer negundo]